jgi:hypothetical protein
MATVLTSAMIAGAKAAADNYITTVSGLNGELDGVISGLTGGNFMGDASNGYAAFYNNQVVPALDTNLIAQQGSLMAGVKDILDTLKTQLLDTIDPKMGESNQNPGGGA